MNETFNKLAADKVDGRYISSVKVGAKGQIVIPKEARDMFHIHPGDNVILLADVERGIAIVNSDLFNQIFDQVVNATNEPS